MKWLQMFNSDGESTTLAQMNPGTETGVGVFQPPVDSIIRRIAIIIGHVAATSLIEVIRVELESTDWVPNRLHFVATGVGLRTAPAFHVPVFEYEVELPMRSSLGIRGDYIHASGTPVSSYLTVMCGFD